jgi:hypothetical protein
LATGWGRRSGANFSRAFDKLEDHGKRVLFDRQPFDRMVRCRTVARCFQWGLLFVGFPCSATGIGAAGTSAEQLGMAMLGAPVVITGWPFGGGWFAG